MLIAFISDVHGNGPALEEVVEKISTLRPDTVICLGDVVGYGPHVQRAVNLVQATTDVYLRGNHEDMLIHPAKKIRANLNAREAIEYSDKQLRTPAQRDFLRLLPTEYVDLAHGVYCGHGTASSFEDNRIWDYVITSADAADGLNHLRSLSPEKSLVCFIGHVHIAGAYFSRHNTHLAKIVSHDPHQSPSLIIPEDTTGIVNVGSVGQPRDRDPRACFVTYDTQTRTVTWHRVAYDIQKTQTDILAAGLPDDLAHRLAAGC